MSTNTGLKKRLTEDAGIAGTFIKTAHPAVIEILGSAGFDFLVLDAEHVAIGREGVDHAVLAARAAGIAMLVRIPAATPEWIGTALDCGAAGIVAPHVRTADEATKIVAACRYGPQGRGFSPSTRAADYGRRTIAEHLEAASSDAMIVVQIEDPEGVQNASAIAGIDGIDCLFVGPVDLAVASGSTDPQAVGSQCESVIRAAIGAGVAGGMFCANGKSAQRWRDAGARFIVIGTDQAFLKAGAAAALR